MMKWNRVQVIGTLLITGLVCMVAQAASISRPDIPAGGNWYIHVNLDLMKSSEVGRKLMLGTVDENLDDYQEELGVDIRKEIQGISLFGAKLPERDIVEGLVALKATDQSEEALGEVLRQVRFESGGAVVHMNMPIAADQIEALRNR